MECSIFQELTPEDLWVGVIVAYIDVKYLKLMDSK